MVTSHHQQGDSVVADKTRVWSDKGLIPFSTTRSYDPAPDGKHIVALIRAETPCEPSGHVVFLLNFFDELRRRAPFDSN